jgi:hypothetical protein
LIGEILVDHHRERVNINQRMVEDGMAFPAYYNSMSAKEIAEFRQKAATARSKKSGTVWNALSKHVGELDRKLVYRGKGSKAKPAPKADRGAVLEPKLFRRQTNYWVGRWNGIDAGSFAKFVSQRKDGWTDLNAFLANPGQRKPEHPNFGPLLAANDMYARDPGSIVFFEKSGGKLYDAKGKEITAWK